jgi:hypothetical protein
MVRLAPNLGIAMEFPDAPGWECDIEDCPTCKDPDAQHCAGCGCDTAYIPGNPHDTCYECFWGPDAD